MTQMQPEMKLPLSVRCADRVKLSLSLPFPTQSHSQVERSTEKCYAIYAWRRPLENAFPQRRGRLVMEKNSEPHFPHVRCSLSSTALYQVNQDLNPTETFRIGKIAWEGAEQSEDRKGAGGIGEMHEMQAAGFWGHGMKAFSP